MEERVCSRSSTARLPINKMRLVSCAFAAPAYPLVPRTYFCSDRRRPQLPPRVAQLRRRVRASAVPDGHPAVVEIGTGTDLHGQDATVAAVRACRNGDFSRMTVHVKLGVPTPFGKDIDEDRVRDQFPYGKVIVEIVDGGLCSGSGVVLSEHGDAKGDDRAIVVVAAVSVFC